MNHFAFFGLPCTFLKINLWLNGWFWPQINDIRLKIRLLSDGQSTSVMNVKLALFIIWIDIFYSFIRGTKYHVILWLSKERSYCLFNCATLLYHGLSIDLRISSFFRCISLKLRSSRSASNWLLRATVGQNSSAHVVSSRAAIWTLISFKWSQLKP